MDRLYPDDSRWPHPQFVENRAKVPQKVLDEYENQYVAWNWEGTQVLAAANDAEALDAKLADLGIDANRVAGCRRRSFGDRTGIFDHLGVRSGSRRTVDADT